MIELHSDQAVVRRVRRDLRLFAREYARSDLGTRTLALTAQFALSAAPVLVAAAALVHRFRHADLMSLLTELFGLHGSARADVTQLFLTSATADTGSQFLGLLVGIAFATGASATLQRCLEIFWHLPKAPFKQAWRQVLWVLALIPFFTLSIRLATLLQKVHPTPAITGLIAPLGLGIGSVIFIWWTQRFLLLGRVSWRALAPGSLLTGVGLMLLSMVTQVVASSQIAEDVNDYGLVAASFALLVEVWCMSGVILGGTLIGAMLRRTPGLGLPNVGSRR
ncbi:YhjD/YihY/BrkB family envelope integrity protein [Nocardioides baekrokdamisoli]|uniref:YhjD/YihY/BrkB family envelope integrity protein n=1 Tax=Nocardioides baekrokdamisoli TaxID=1804624 RepID=UPI0013DDFA4F|nr:YhjD/YihY/BrkB family envelope integrity protein [Nocardioides baekrokdamisoli]